MCLFEAALVSLRRVVSVADTSVITLPILTPGRVYPNLHHQYSKLVDCEELFYGISRLFNLFHWSQVELFMMWFISKTLCADQPDADICGNLPVKCKLILSSTNPFKRFTGDVICVIRPQLCSFLILVIIFQLQIHDQNKAKTQE